MEQSAIAWTGYSRSNICCLRFIHISFITLCRIYHTRGHRGVLLSGRRRTYEHAVRMGKEKISQLCFNKKGIHSPTQPSHDSLQCCLVDTHNSSLYRGNQLYYRLHHLSDSYRDKTRC